MATIPLPALDVRPAPNPLEEYAKIAGIKSMMMQQQTGQQQQQLQSQEIQKNQMQLQDMQTLRELGPKYVTKDESGKVTGFDFNGLANDATGKGVNPATVQALQLQHAQTVKEMAGADEATRNNELAKNKAAYESIESIRSIKDPQQRAAAYPGAVEQLKKAGVDTSKLPQQYPGDQALDSYEAGLGMHAQILADAKTKAETEQSVQRANLDKAEALQKGSPLAAMEANPAEMAGEKLPAAIGYLQSKISDPNADPVDKARATRLLATAKTTQAVQLAFDKSKKETEQAVQDGDSKAAAKLLVSGVVAPSQLISSRKPEFAQKAFTEAQHLKPGWNAQTADAEFKVASSPSNVAFFGSAKSLVDPGGTLDQLKDAGKDIPQGKFPIFNSVDDALKESTGSGPIAKYASIALGVADDYSKVMGGGQGSDTSRTQALQLISKKLSPEQRTSSIEGIRGSVNSQKNSRIGKNSVLRQMYGDSEPETKVQQSVGHKVGDVIVQNNRNFKVTAVDQAGKVTGADAQP